MFLSALKCLSSPSHATSFWPPGFFHTHSSGTHTQNLIEGCQKVPEQKIEQQDLLDTMVSKQDAHYTTNDV